MTFVDDFLWNEADSPGAMTRNPQASGAND